MSAVFLITGPSAAGKTTVARLLAERFRRGVHLEGDVFRRSVVSGRAEMTPMPSDEALEQLRLRYRLAAGAADVYFAAGFTVVLEDVAAGDELPRLVELIAGRPLHVVVLLPSIEAIRSRDNARGHTGYAQWPAEELHAVFAEGRRASATGSTLRIRSPRRRWTRSSRSSTAANDEAEAWLQWLSLTRWWRNW